MIFQRYSIATRIGSVVGVILMMMLILAVVETKGLNSIRKSLDDIVGKHYQRLQVAQEMRFLARNNAVIVRNILLITGNEEQEHERLRFEEGAAQYAALLEQLTREKRSEEEETIIKEVVRGGEITFNLWRTITDAESSSGTLDSMQILQAEVRNQQWGLLGNLNDLVQVEKHMAEITMQEALEHYATTKSVMAIINILAIGAGLFSVAAITASIVGPLNEISRQVDKIAGGDFAARIELDQEDEIGQLAGHINSMVEKLNANEDELEEYRYHLEELIEWRTGEMNEQRERFISVLIHDLKGPLVPIIGFSRLLVEQESLSEEKISRYAQEIHESTMNLANVIDQTSRSLKEKRTSFSFDKEPFDLKELLYSVSRNCLPVLAVERVTLLLNGQEPDVYMNSAESIMFSGDVSKLRSIMENLIGNAGKYACSRIDVHLERKGEGVELLVDDDGGGVAELFRKKIFEEYYQVPGSKDGTGVGLYSVKRIVDHYQGRISVQTSPLGGARFIITLPLS